MKTANLKKYLERMNRWSRFTGSETIDLKKMDDEMAQSIFNWLDGDLSPENLHCDGEITKAEANRKYRLFTKAGAELKAMGYRPKDRWSEFA